MPEDAEPATAAALRCLLPLEIRCAGSALPSDCDAALALLHPAERSLVERAIPKRRREFAVGRQLARKLLGELGFEPQPLLRGSDRAPRWPAGVVGAISHDARECVAAVARIGRIRGVGLDVEPREELEPRLWRAICTEGECERALTGSDPLPAGLRARAIFSAKESLYKCLHPTFGWPVGFHDVEVALDWETRSFRARPALDSRSRPSGADLAAKAVELERVRGALVLEATTIATACWWETARVVP
jgi:4'-phosphopantetheinyl transferase EntD